MPHRVVPTAAAFHCGGFGVISTANTVKHPNGQSGKRTPNIIYAINGVPRAPLDDSTPPLPLFQSNQRSGEIRRFVTASGGGIFSTENSKGGRNLSERAQHNRAACADVERAPRPTLAGADRRPEMAGGVVSVGAVG